MTPDFSPELRLEHARALTRREFFARSGVFSLGSLALGQLLGGNRLTAGVASLASPPNPLSLNPSPLPARAKSVTYLHMSEAPPSLDLFDFKTELQRLNMQPCPESLLKGQRFAFIKGVPKMLGSPYN